MTLFADVPAVFAASISGLLVAKIYQIVIDKNWTIKMEEGIPLLGYSPWSSLDSLSGREGFAKRYGLVYVDRTDDDLKELKRYKKDSYFWYQKLISDCNK